jgi:hypothetical protein
LLVVGAGHHGYRLGTTAYRAVTAARVPVLVAPRRAGQGT